MTLDAAEKAGVPVVRGLDWADYGDGEKKGINQFGLSYLVWYDDIAEGWRTNAHGGVFSNEAAAMSAAQASHDRLVLSALNPDFLSELDTARAEIERLRAALAFYRDGFTFIIDKRRPGLAWVPTETLLDDCGNIARIALADDPAAPSTLSPAVKEPK